jgi:hypothetical protein
VTKNRFPYAPPTPLSTAPGITHGPPEIKIIGAPPLGDSTTRYDPLEKPSPPPFASCCAIGAPDAVAAIAVNANAPFEKFA